MNVEIQMFFSETCGFGSTHEGYHGGSNTISLTSVISESDCKVRCEANSQCQVFATRMFASYAECRQYSLDGYVLTTAPGYKLTKKYCDGKYLQCTVDLKWLEN